METTVETFARRIAAGMKQSGQYSAAKTCLTMLRGLLRTAGTRKLSFNHLTAALLKEYEHQLLCNDCTSSTVSLYIRTLQTLCRKAEEAGIAKLPKDLFAKVFTGYPPASRRSVSTDTMQRLYRAELTDKSLKLAYARDLFLLSFYLRGIPFIDLAHLRRCDLRNGILHYQRSKTDMPACIHLEPCALEIIHRYADLYPVSPYLLPIIRKSGTCADEQRQYESALRLYNKHLNALSEFLGLETPITSYSARHTWANTAHDLGIDIADISEALCHSSEKMTRHYLRSFSPDRLARVNKRVIACITNDKETKKDRGKPKNRGILERNTRSGSA
ncbi:MAG: site-specific integrase [Bacteroides sp.]|nr:site-specific integrase [Bacteroides sp.]